MQFPSRSLVSAAPVFVSDAPFLVSDSPVLVSDSEAWFLIHPWFPIHGFEFPIHRF